MTAKQKMNKHRKKYVESHREILRNRIEHAIDDYVECTKDRIAKVEPYYLRSKCAETDGEVNLLGVEIEYILNATDHIKKPKDVLNLLKTLAYQCENFNNGNHSGSFDGVNEALDFIEQVDSAKLKEGAE